MEPNDWVTSRDGAVILSKNSGHHVADDYVRWLARHGHIRSWTLGRRTKLYKRCDVEAYVVRRIASNRHDAEDSKQERVEPSCDRMPPPIDKGTLEVYNNRNSPREAEVK